MLDQDQLRRIAAACLSLPANFISPEQALNPCAAGRPLVEPPLLLGVAAADDPLFAEYKQPGVIGPYYLKPEEWLPGAQSVISVFLPQGRAWRCWPGVDQPLPGGWFLYGPESILLQEEIAQALTAAIQAEGYAALAPRLDRRYWQSDSYCPESEANFTSNWSERHAAFAAGLGTFSLNFSMITKRGMAGRFISVVTRLPLMPDIRPYTGISEYCSNCGVCIRRCPMRAIDKKGKNKRACAAWGDVIRGEYSNVYTCNACHTETPCSEGIPPRAEP